MTPTSPPVYAYFRLADCIDSVPPPTKPKARAMKTKTRPASSACSYSLVRRTDDGTLLSTLAGISVGGRGLKRAASASSVLQEALEQHDDLGGAHFFPSAP